MSDVLEVKGEFDPKGIVGGVDIGIASLEEFEQAFRAVIKVTGSQNASEAEFNKLAQMTAQEVKAAAEELAVFENRMKGVLNATGKVSANTHDATRATHLLRTGLTGLAVEATGASGPVGHLAQSLLLFGGGATAVLGVAAAIGVLGLAYEKLTEKSRELSKEVDGIVESFRNAQKSEADKLAEQIAKVGDEIEASGKKIMFFTRLQLTGSKWEDEIRRYNELRSTLVDLKEAYDALNRAASRASHGAADTAMLRLMGADKGGRGSGGDSGAAARAAAAAAAEARKIFALEFKNLDELGRNAVRQSSEMAKQWGDNWAKGIAASADATTEAQDAMDEYHKNAKAGLDDLLTAEEILTEAIQKQREAWLEVTDGIAGVVQAAASVGLIGQNAAQAVFSVLDLADALQQVATVGLSLGSILGVVGAGISFIGGLGSGHRAEMEAVEREHNDILQRNNDALDATRASINEWNDSIEARSKASGDIGKLDPSVLAAIDHVASFGTGTTIDATFLDNELKKVGSSLKELDAIARANGIQLLDKDGRVVAEAFEQLREQLDLLVSQDLISGIADSLVQQQKDAADAAEKAAADAKQAAEDAARAMEEAARAAEELAAANRAAQIAMSEEVRTRFELKNRLTGVDDPQIVFDQIVEALSHSSAVLRKNIGDLNLDTPELREAFRQRMIAWLDAVQSGTMTAADLGLTDEQFNELIGAAADFLDKFKDSTSDATDALDEMVTGLLNVPTGLNLAEAEWMARLKNPELHPGSAVPVGSGGGGTGVEPWMGSGGAAGSGGRMVTESTGNWTINVNGVTDPDKVADLVVTRVKRIAGAAFGDNQKWSQI